MKKLFYSLIVFLLFSLAGLVVSASAQSRLTYPIPDLGYCRDAKECSLYCDIPQNKAACWSYGKYKLGSDVLGVTTMSEEEKRMMESKAKQYGITFPIADLGGCAGPQECRDFCEQPTNQQACMDFAKRKGFAKEMERPDGMDAGKRDELIQKAKTELGCTSMESCSQVCETDHSRCESFARKHGVYQEPPPSSGRYSSEEKMQLMQKAESELGCTSMESCKSVCEKNPQACMAFAKKHGFDRPQGPEGEEKMDREDRVRGPMAGKCDSEDSCKKYCQEHPNECPGFQNSQRATGGQQPPSGTQFVGGGGTNYVGPSGCRTEAECKAFCETSPDKCPGFSQVKQKEMESSQELQKRQYEYRPPTTSSGESGGGSGYQTTQPSSGSYTPPATQPAAP